MQSVKRSINLFTHHSDENGVAQKTSIYARKQKLQTSKQREVLENHKQTT